MGSDLLCAKRNGGYDGYIFAKDTTEICTADIGLNTDGAIEAASYIQKLV